MNYLPVEYDTEIFQWEINLRLLSKGTKDIIICIIDWFRSNNIIIPETFLKKLLLYHWNFNYRTTTLRKLQWQRNVIHIKFTVININICVTDKDKTNFNVSQKLRIFSHFNMQKMLFSLKITKSLYLISDFDALWDETNLIN